MGKARTFLTLTLALAAATACQAASLIDTSFAEGSKGWVLDGEAKLAKAVGGTGGQVLTLTSGDTDQVGIAWTELKQKVPSFSFLADVRVRYDGGGVHSCPGDGFTLAFAPVPSDTISVKGTGGAGLGLFGRTMETFTALEVNTWAAQGLGGEEAQRDCKSGKDETFAYDVIYPGAEDAQRAPGRSGTPEHGGAKIGQVVAPEGMKIVNGGLYRYQWNASDDGTMTVYVTGLEDGNKKFQKVKVLQVKMAKKPVDFEGRFGLTAATGWAVQTVEVARARVESPMIEP